MAVARCEIATGLGDTDDGTTRLQLLARHAVVHEAFDVERGHVSMTGIVKPLLTSQGPRSFFRHGFISC
ncbi:hypothetical protein D3C87_1472300 [compost metagenome]